MKNQDKIKAAIEGLVGSIAAVNACEDKLRELQEKHEKEKVDLQTEFKNLTEAVRDSKMNLKKVMHAVYGSNESQVFFKIGGGFVQFRLTKEGELQISDEVPGDVLA